MTVSRISLIVVFLGYKVDLSWLLQFLSRIVSDLLFISLHLSSDPLSNAQCRFSLRISMFRCLFKSLVINSSRSLSVGICLPKLLGLRFRALWESPLDFFFGLL